MVVLNRPAATFVYSGGDCDMPAPLYSGSKVVRSAWVALKRQSRDGFKTPVAHCIIPILLRIVFMFSR
jgi:hypothetical protein